MNATAMAHPNFALIKYWGKHDVRLNTPAAGSISVTVDDLYTRADVEFRTGFDRDRVAINGRPADPDSESRVVSFLDLVREHAGLRRFARVKTHSNFPAATGLASSSSAFAALAAASCAAIGLNIGLQELSGLARRGSGSAARSVFGGFVEMIAGERRDGKDSVATPIADEHFWPLGILVAITSEDRKPVGSSAGMLRTAETSPYYNSWIESTRRDVPAMREALKKRDLDQVGDLMEHSCLKMHGLMLSAKPGLVYWNSGTLQVIDAVRNLRRQGIAAYFTIDAGPQVKVVCEKKDLNRVKPVLQNLTGVIKLIETQPGPAVRILEAD